ncbi:NADH-quinone oxidoreductase subunit C [Streptomyces sp. NBC_01218]|uniref:NADH-quinone oxidoreductase subunit C n=1 Tax=Streptomyces sp. NBC_01218 TaxID=2903780 RepID=UPI002E15C5D9|nr:NADH-quinone oxidoreductase subunit C [Streptomyces sp. NBC_01218]
MSGPESAASRRYGENPQNAENAMSAESPENAASLFDRLLDADPDTVARTVAGLFGERATAAYAYELLTVDVPADTWTAALETARDRLGCTYFDWLSAVDEPGTGFLVAAHVAALSTGTVRRLLVRTTVPHEAAVLPSAIAVYAGAAWHERETHEMFGIGFEGHPHLVPLLLPEGFEGHPLRKDFVLAARVAKAWPGAKEPGESEHGGPKRRTMLPPGVPDPNEWGPLKGQLPPAPARPARATRAGAGAAERPVRRARSVTEGSAGRRPPTAPPTGPDTPATGPAAPAAGQEGPAAPAAATPAEGAPPARPARRSRSASAGSASQRTEGAAPDGTQTSATDPEASGRSGTAAVPGAPAKPAPRTTGSADAPWHHARPAFDDGSGAGVAKGAAEPEPDAARGAEPDAAREPDAPREPEPDAPREPEPDAAREAEPEAAREPEPDAPREPASEAGRPAERDASADPGQPGPEVPAEPAGPPDPEVPADRAAPDDPHHRPSGGDSA